MRIDAFLLLQSQNIRNSCEKFKFGLKYCLHAESLGYGAVWLGEHHFSDYSPLSRPLIYAAYIAANTKLIRIGTAAVLLPIHHPLIVAEELATLDVLSNGRLELGFSFAAEHFVTSRIGVAYDQLDSKCREALTIISAALRDGTVEHDGEFFKVSKSIVRPRPIQKPLPPIWIVANSEDSLIYSRSNGYGSLTRGIFSSRGEGQNINYLQRYSQNQCRNGVQAIVYIAEDLADKIDAMNRARQVIAFTLNLRGGLKNSSRNHELHKDYVDSIVNSHALIGTAEEVLDKIVSAASFFNLSHLICNFCFADIEPDRVFGSMSRFSKLIMPALR
jgi:alkanesulfonate monooxygenase SsuD/methylene tetrahydromethanopterin reductase-like flavin-dependent oxidoreductase (luciferase family)